MSFTAECVGNMGLLSQRRGVEVEALTLEFNLTKEPDCMDGLWPWNYVSHVQQCFRSDFKKKPI